MDAVRSAISLVSVFILPAILVGFPLYGLYKRVPVYETFVEGAKEGFGTAVRIIPYLVAILFAIAMFRASGATMHESAVLNNLGLTQARLGQAEAAEQTLRDALVLSERSGYRLGVVNAMRSLGRLYTGQRRFGEAGRLLADALDVAEAHRLKPDQAECHQALSEYFEHTGDFASALKHYRRYHQLERDVLNDTTSKQVKALQIRHQVAAAQRDAEIHRLRNIELARAYADLEAANSSLKESDVQKTRLLAQPERQTFEDALKALTN